MEKSQKKKEIEAVRRFFLGVWIGVLTLAAVVGAGLVLADREQESLPPATEAVAESTQVPTEQTLPPETEAPEILPAETVAEKTVYNTVPSYFQTDYPHIKFGNGTIATSGCSVTCLAMVATYLTDQAYSPVQMAYHFGSYGKNNIERLDYGIAQMQLPYERTEDIQVVLQALREGKVAIVMMDEESVFTAEQHFVVLAGRNTEGKVIVHDPMEHHYTDTELHVQNAFKEGFEDFYLMRGFSGGWIFDKAAMPEEPFLFDASLPEQQENRYAGYTLTGEDIYTLACFVWAEGRDQPPEVQQAMVEVVLNRLVSAGYPNTVQDLMKKTEFYRAAEAMARIQEPEQAQYIAVNSAMYGPYILPEDICFYSEWETGQDPWGQLGSYTFYRSR